MIQSISNTLYCYVECFFLQIKLFQNSNKYVAMMLVFFY